MNITSYIDGVKQEETRNNDFLHITANEGQMSETARMFLKSKLSERYYMGAGVDNMYDNGTFCGLAMPATAQLIDAAEAAAKEMLGAAVVNLNCLSGLHAMMCAVLSCTKPGDTVMSVPHEYGGHFATTGVIDAVGRKNVATSFDIANLRFDTEALAKTFKESGATAFYMDVSYYINPHNLREIREALGPDAIIIYDASHTMGLIMGQTFQNPFQEGANVICANTHKTLQGPQKGMIAFRDQEFGEKANAIINGSLYSSPHLHHMIALATTILELKEFGREYAQQVIANSNAVGEAFSALGYNIRKANTGRYSENHQVHILLEGVGDRKELWHRLLNNGISANFDDPLGGHFLRFGTQEITRRGMKEAEMKQIVSFIDRAFKGENLKEEVIAFNKQFTKIHYSFD